MTLLTRYVWAKLSPEERESLMARPSAGSDAFAVAANILAEVRGQGAAAVRRYAQELDGYAPDDFRVPAGDLKTAADALDPRDANAILAAADAVRRYHEKQGYKSYSLETWPGGIASRRVTPLEVAGLYVPAGTAPLVSTLIMNIQHLNEIIESSGVWRAEHIGEIGSGTGKTRAFAVEIALEGQELLAIGKTGADQRQTDARLLAHLVVVTQCSKISFLNDTAHGALLEQIGHRANEAGIARAIAEVEIVEKLLADIERAFAVELLVQKAVHASGA